MRSFINIHRSEAEQTKAAVDQAVLAAIVIHQAIAMIAAVVLDCQSLKAIKQIWPAQQMALIVMDGTLNLRPRESTKYEEHPQPRLHSGLGLWLGQVDHTPEPRYALGAGMFGDVSV